VKGVAERMVSSADRTGLHARKKLTSAFEDRHQTVAAAATALTATRHAHARCSIKCVEGDRARRTGALANSRATHNFTHYYCASSPRMRWLSRAPPLRPWLIDPASIVRRTSVNVLPGPQASLESRERRYGRKFDGVLIYLPGRVRV
jgi:hypothetical protein